MYLNGLKIQRAHNSLKTSAVACDPKEPHPQEIGAYHLPGRRGMLDAMNGLDHRGEHHGEMRRGAIEHPSMAVYLLPS